jgi:hypothetical protein
MSLISTDGAVLSDNASASGFCVAIQILDMKWPGGIADRGNVERYSTLPATFQFCFIGNSHLKNVQIVSMKGAALIWNKITIVNALGAQLCFGK